MVYLVPVILSLIAITPSSLCFELYITNEYVWTYLIVVSAFLAFFLLFQKVNPFVKFVAIGGLINCFFSLSFTNSSCAYISLLGGCYFYWGCTRIKDWDLVFKVLLSVVLLNCFLMAMQALGKDSLLNYGKGKNLLNFGTTGARMQMESLLIISSAFILQSRYRMAVWGMFFATGLYLIIFKMNAISQGGFLHNPFNSRLPVWQETIAFANQYPWTGLGIGTFKLLYHVMSQLHTQPWASPHNDFLQILYEGGRIAFIAVVVYICILIWRMVERREWRLLIGLLLIVLDMNVHFPLREFQTFPIVIAFLAFCEVRLVGSQVK